MSLGPSSRVPNMVKRLRELMIVAGVVSVLASPLAGTPTPPLAATAAGEATAPGSSAPADRLVWERLEGPPGGWFTAVATHPVTAGLVYASTQKGVYRSFDGGASWNPLFDRPADQLVVSAHQPDWVYGRFHGQLHKSTNMGTTWTPLGVADGRYLSRISVSPTDAHVVYAGTAEAPAGEPQPATVVRSTDGGATWIDLQPPIERAEGSIQALAAVSAQEVWIGTGSGLVSGRAGRLYHTIDGGQTWATTDLGTDYPEQPATIALDPADSATVYVGWQNALNQSVQGQRYFTKTEDRGLSWTDLSLPGTDSHVGVVAVSPHASNVVVAGSGGYLYISEDAGRSWSFVNFVPFEYLRLFDHHTLAFDAVDPVTFFTAQSIGLLKTSDLGQTWSLLRSGIAETTMNLVAVDPTNPAHVYAASTQGEGVFGSWDYGETWEQLDPRGVSHPWIDDIAINPTDSHELWIAADIGRLYHTVNAGLTVTRQARDFTFDSVYALVAHPTEAERLFAHVRGLGVFGSEGPFWRYLTGSPDYTYSIAIDPTDPDRMLSGSLRKLFEHSAGAFRTLDGGETWQEVLDVPGAEGVTSIVLAPDDPQVVYAGVAGEPGTGGSIHASNDGGSTWHRLAAPFDFTTIHAMAAPPNDPTTVVAGAWGGQTWITTDGGAHWSEFGAPATFSVSAIALHPTDPSTLYVADRTRPTVHRSIDGGASWHEYANADPTEHFRATALLVDPADPATVYFSAQTYGAPAGLEGSLFRTRNGVTEEITNPSDRAVLHLASSDRGALYAVTHGHSLYRSVDAGATWIDISGDLPPIGFFSITPSPTSADTLYLAAGASRQPDLSVAIDDPGIVHAVYKTVDGGTSWFNATEGTGIGSVKQVAIHPDDPEVLYAAAENGVWLSTDGGAHWSVQDGLPFTDVATLAVFSDRIYAGTHGAGVFNGDLGADFSIRWADANALHAHVRHVQMTPHPTDPAVLFASAYPGGVFKTTDRGLTWHEANFALPSFAVADPLIQGYYALRISPSDPNRIYLGLYDHGVFRSDDGGDTWRPASGADGRMRNAAIADLLIDPNEPDRVWVGTEEGIWRSDDGGVQWQAEPVRASTNDVRTLVMAADGTVYAGTRGYGVLQRTAATDWEVAHSQPRESGPYWPEWDRPLYQFTSILFHPDDPDVMWMGTFPMGMFKSTDGGETWVEKNIGFGNDGVLYLVIHPSDPDLIYAGTYNGVSRSTDGGETWELFNTGIPLEHWVYHLGFDPSNAAVMYAATRNGSNRGSGVAGDRGGVFKSIDGGETWFEIMDDLDRDQEFFAVFVDPNNTNVLFLETQHQGIWRSLDAGGSWEPINEGLEGVRTGAFGAGGAVTGSMRMDPGGHVIYLGTIADGVYRLVLRDLPPAPDPPVFEPTPVAHSVGMVDPTAGRWYLRGGDGVVRSFYFGTPGDFPIVGDWNCDGIDTPGLYRQSDGFVYLRNSNTTGIAEIRFHLGIAGDLPLAGDFDGDGCDTVSVYRPSLGRVYVADTLGTNDGWFVADYDFYYGVPGDKPFTGDFDGDGTDTIGLHRESSGYVYFRNSNSFGVADSEFFFGVPDDRLVAGDWNANGADTVGIYRPSVGTFYLRYTNTLGFADAQIEFGEPGWLPVAGDFGFR